jgi:hypothetical protein
MDVVYAVLAFALWLLTVGMSTGCAKLGGPKQ